MNAYKELKSETKKLPTGVLHVLRPETEFHATWEGFLPVDPSHHTDLIFDAVSRLRFFQFNAVSYCRMTKLCTVYEHPPANGLRNLLSRFLVALKACHIIVTKFGLKEKFPFIGKFAEVSMAIAKTIEKRQQCGFRD